MCIRDRYGEELFLLENILKKIKNIFGECIKGINYINIDDTNISELISDIAVSYTHLKFNFSFVNFICYPP